MGLIPMRLYFCEVTDYLILPDLAPSAAKYSILFNNVS